jgi:hypothetical protein
MQVQEVISMLRWVNETDPRVMFNDAAVEVWLYALRPTDPAVAKQAVLEHYKANEGIAASPGAISKRARNIAASREAGQRAIGATPQPMKTEADYRRKIRETPEFMALFEEGRRQGNEERRRATEARSGTQEPDHSGWMAA